MGESRGKKAKKGKKTKKTGWQLQLGFKEVIFAGLGLAGMVMMSFALGILAGRGDIYRVLHNWGVLSPEAGRAIQAWPPAAPPPPSRLAAPASPPPPTAPATAKAPTAAPVKGNIAAPPSSSQAKKKSAQRNRKRKDKGLKNLRREVAKKLKFQNSLDPAVGRSARGRGKSKKDKGRQEKTSRSRSSRSRVFVAKFRDGRRARAKLAMMRKQGEKVVLKEGKDGEGRYYAIYREVTARSSKSPQVAQRKLKKTKVVKKPNKSSGQNKNVKKKKRN